MYKIKNHTLGALSIGGGGVYLPLLIRFSLHWPYSPLGTYIVLIP